MIERYSFVAITAKDLPRARGFWVDAMGFRVTEEAPGRFFIVDAGGLRLCVDVPDGGVHGEPGGDPVIGLKVGSLSSALSALAARGLFPERGPTPGTRGAWAQLRDPDGHPVVLTEAD